MNDLDQTRNTFKRGATRAGRGRNRHHQFRTAPEHRGDTPDVIGKEVAKEGAYAAEKCARASSTGDSLYPMSTR